MIAGGFSRWKESLLRTVPRDIGAGLFRTRLVMRGVCMQRRYSISTHGVHFSFVEKCLDFLRDGSCSPAAGQPAGKAESLTKIESGTGERMLKAPSQPRPTPPHRKVFRNNTKSRGLPRRHLACDLLYSHFQFFLSFPVSDCEQVLRQTLPKPLGFRFSSYCPHRLPRQRLLHRSASSQTTLPSPGSP